MAGSAARSSITSGISAGKQPASKKSPNAKPKPAERLVTNLFAELARIAEMSAVERRLRDSGFRAIAGTDEVGRGCLAGPLGAAACFILDPEPPLVGVNDSKLVDHDDRIDVCRLILRRARACAVGVIEPQTIDTINILQASKRAMIAAVENLEIRPDILLLDAVTIDMDLPQVPLIGGDRRSVSIAAASIVAKVYRDLLMESYHDLYPVYD